MAKDLAKWAKDKGVKYFMISYTDLFGGQRAKLVPTQAINEMAEDGAGFAGFAKVDARDFYEVENPTDRNVPGVKF